MNPLLIVILIILILLIVWVIVEKGYVLTKGGAPLVSHPIVWNAIVREVNARSRDHNPPTRDEILRHDYALQNIYRMLVLNSKLFVSFPFSATIFFTMFLKFLSFFIVSTIQPSVIYKSFGFSSNECCKNSADIGNSTYFPPNSEPINPYDTFENMHAMNPDVERDAPNDEVNYEIANLNGFNGALRHQAFTIFPAGAEPNNPELNPVFNPGPNPEPNPELNIEPNPEPNPVYANPVPNLED